LHYTHLTPPVLAGAKRNHTGKNRLRLWRERLLVAIDGRMAAGFSIGTPSLHVAQYAPCERVLRKSRTLSLAATRALTTPARLLRSQMPMLVV
jgi:hypothetical protein